MNTRMKQFFQQDSIAVGLTAGLGSLLATALLLAAGLLLAGEPPTGHLEWFAGCFAAPLLIMRLYIKHGKATAAKTMMAMLFVTFVAFMFVLFKTHSIVLQ